MCSFTDPLACPGEIAGDVAGGAAESVAGNAIQNFADAVSEAVASTIKAAASIWTKTPSPNVETSATVESLQDSLWWYMAAAAVLSLIIAGARMAMEMRSQPLRQAIQSLFTLVLVTGCGLAAVQIALEAGDGFSRWIIGESGGEGFSERLSQMVTALSGGTGSALGAVLVIVLGLFMVFASMVQIVLMVARGAILILLVAVWPLSASATNTAWGKQWFTRISGWIIAFILYKPAAALIYAAGFEMFGNEEGLMGVLMGVCMVVLGVLALPALMRLCVPMVGGLGAAGGAGAGAALGAAAASGMGKGPSGAAPAPAASASTSSPAPAPSSPKGAESAGASSSGAAMAKGAGGAGKAAGAGGAASAGGASTAGAAAGPVGAGVAAAAQAGKAAHSAAKNTAQQAAGEEGPSGSQQ